MKRSYANSKFNTNLKKTLLRVSVVTILIILALTFLTFSKFSSIGIKSYGSFHTFQKNSQYVSLLIEHDGASLTSIFILALNPDNTLNFLNIPLDYFYSINNNYINLKDTYGLNYLIEDESTSFNKIQSQLSQILNINLSNYFVLSQETKVNLSKIYFIDSALSLNKWIIEASKHSSDFKLIFSGDKLQTVLSKGLYSSQNKQDMIYIASKIQSNNLITNYNITSSYINQTNINGEIRSVVDKLSFQSLLIKLLQQQSIIDEQSKIEIFNSTPVLNLGSNISQKLNNYGLNVARVNYVSDFQEKTIIYVQNDKPNSIKEMKQILQNTQIKYSKSPLTSISDIVIIVGNDEARLD